MLRLRQHLRFQIACSKDREDGEALRHLYPGVIGLLVVSYKEDSELGLKTVSSGPLMWEMFIDIGSFKD